MTDTETHTLAYQDLSPDDVIASVESLGYECDGRLLALNSYENRVYQVGIEGAEPLVAKFYRPGRWSDAAIDEEHGFARELAEADVPVVRPLEHDGSTLHRHGDFRFAVYPRRGGRAPELDDSALLEQLGRFVARLHNVGAHGRFEHRPGLSIARMGEASAEFLVSAGFIPDHLKAAYDTLSRDLLDEVSECLERVGPVASMRIHGDFHPGNVLVREDRIHIVDLDDTCTGPAVQDLWMFLSGGQLEQESELEHLLSGYAEFREFDPVELCLVEALRTLRMMHYAAWLARRWQDPAFQRAFPWFNTNRYWEDHVLSLREQLAALGEAPLRWRGPDR